MIKIIIHRGTHQIGGCATEIEYEGERILIDLGANLPGTDEKAETTDNMLLDRVFGTKRDRSFDAVLFSHYHGDHYGLYRKIPANIPMYIGNTAQKILETVTTYTDINSATKGLKIIRGMKNYVPGVPIPGLKKMSVRPYYVDHSALDAYMFLIEAGGKKILFTGDFRDHGIANERGQLWAVIKKYIKAPVDVLITEGTMVSRIEEAQNNIVKTEAMLGTMAGEVFLQKKYNFVAVSSTNLDSIMEFYHNTPKDKLFVCDAYQAGLMLTAMEAYGKQYDAYRGKLEEGSKSKHIHIIGDINPKLYYLLNKRGAALKNKKLPPVFFKRLEDDSIKQLEDKGFVMLVRPNRFSHIYPKNKYELVMDCFRQKFEGESQVIYSMWSGYLEGDKADADIIRLIGDFKRIDLHTSGHAYVKTLARLMDEVQPKVIIPMHTEMAEHFDNVEEFEKWKNRIMVLCDGKEYVIKEQEND